MNEVLARYIRIVSVVGALLIVLIPFLFRTPTSGALKIIFGLLVVLFIGLSMRMFSVKRAMDDAPR